MKQPIPPAGKVDVWRVFHALQSVAVLVMMATMISDRRVRAKDTFPFHFVSALLPESARDILHVGSCWHNFPATISQRTLVILPANVTFVCQ